MKKSESAKNKFDRTSSMLRFEYISNDCFGIPYKLIYIYRKIYPNKNNSSSSLNSLQLCKVIHRNEYLTMNSFQGKCI